MKIKSLFLEKNNDIRNIVKIFRNGDLKNNEIQIKTMINNQLNN